MIKIKHLPILTSALLSMLFIVLYPNNASAIYDGDNIIDNATLFDTSTMNAGDIQNFLSDMRSGLSSRSFNFDCAATDASANLYRDAGAPCGQNVLSSQIIYYASKIYGINPRVILATLQKEQSLITTTNPTSWQISQAMGYGCPTTTGCGSNSDFLYQIDNGTFTMRLNTERAMGNNTYWFKASSWVCGSAKNFYKPSLYPQQSVDFYDQDGVQYRTHYIKNAATSAFYCYTPHAYNNPNGLYGLPKYGTTGRYYSGSYNFVYYFEKWFGSTLAYVHNGVNYSTVFDIDFYLKNHPDVKSALGNNTTAVFAHFIRSGMAESRQAINDFNLISYKNRYPDLRTALGNNLPAYYLHFIRYGKSEGRIATGNEFNATSVYNGVNYSAVYNFDYYEKNNPDIKAIFGLNDNGTLSHFINYGMHEGRQGNANFNVTSYKNRYYDLRRIYENNLRSYAVHYILYGKNEGRIATGDYIGGISAHSGVSYSAVYNFDYYIKNNPDLRAIFGLDDGRALSHFINYGMSEGRQGSADFNVNTYKTKYIDLRTVFGQSLKPYYMHYINYGKAEARIAI